MLMHLLYFEPHYPGVSLIHSHSNVCDIQNFLLLLVIFSLDGSWMVAPAMVTRQLHPKCCSLLGALTGSFLEVDFF